MSEEVEQDEQDEQDEQEEERQGLPIWLPILGVFVLLAGGVAFLLFGSDTSEVFVYSKLLDEVMES